MDGNMISPQEDLALELLNRRDWQKVIKSTLIEQ